jgi:hypothetical protein
MCNAAGDLGDVGREKCTAVDGTERVGKGHSIHVWFNHPAMFFRLLEGLEDSLRDLGNPNPNLNPNPNPNPNPASLEEPVRDGLTPAPSGHVADISGGGGGGGAMPPVLKSKL